HPLLGHVVSRAVLATDENGRYVTAAQSSPVAPLPESRTGSDSEGSSRSSKSPDRSAILSRSDRATLDDPRLVRQLPWVPAVGKWWSSFWTMLLTQLARAISLSLVIVLIPYWLIRAGVRHRELGWWRGVLIVSGLTVAALSIAALQSLSASLGK